MDQDWRKGFVQAVTAFALSRGNVMDVQAGREAVKEARDDSYFFTYGWSDYRADRHVKDCQLSPTPDTEVFEMAFSEFVDTFSANDEESGFIITEVQCACGKLTHRVVRWEGGLEEAFQGILRGK